MKHKLIYIFLAFMIAMLAFMPSTIFAQEDGQDLEKELMALLEAGDIEAATQLLADMDQPDQEPPDGEIDTGREEAVIIVDIEAVGSDINVALAWNPEMDAPQRAQLMVENARGEAINTVDARPQESSVVQGDESTVEDDVQVVSVAGVLENIHEQGLQHDVVVRGDEGEELARYPYHVMLVCEDEENCSYELMGGISTEAILITEELDQALDEIEAEEPEDILAAVVERYPHLQGDVYALAIQISIQEGVNPGEEVNAIQRQRCFCWWTAVVQQTPPGASFFSSPPTSTYKAGWVGPGAAHYFAAKSVGGPIFHFTDGSTKLTMKIRCWGIIGWQLRVIVIHFPWGTIIIKIYVPIFGYCPPQCDGKVTQNIGYLGHTTAETSGNAYAAAFDSAAYRVNGSMAAGFPLSTFSFAGPPGASDADFGLRFASVSTAQPSTAELRTFGAVGGWAEPDSSACAKVVNGFIMSATATASCTIPNTVTSSMLGAHPSQTRYLWLDFRHNYLDRRVCDRQLEGRLGDLGDAPDSSNHFNNKMSAYPPLVIGRYPTVFDVSSPDAPGPKHWEPERDAWLGEQVTQEYDADLLPDQDPTTNIIPPNDQADLDKADDGVHLNTVNIPKCGRTRFNYDVNVVGPLQKRYVNVWFDYNRDGDWSDRLRCETENGTVIEVVEWSVRNHVIALGPGYHNLITPFFAGMDPPDRENPMWMRITLSEAPAPVVPPIVATLTPVEDLTIANPIPVATVMPMPTLVPITGLVPITATRPLTIVDPLFFRADGRGPPSGYKYGETEDYFIQQSPQLSEICGMKWHDLNGNGIKDRGEPGLAGWTIEVYDAAGNLIATVVTDANGSYCFTLPPGSYVVGEVQQGGWIQTFPKPPGTHNVDLKENDSVVDVDFGNNKEPQDIRCPESSTADVKPDCDLGDAPDSTNHAGVRMFTYPAGVTANFPTVYDGPDPRGPRHFNVSDNQRLTWLGRDITCEHEADIGADCDGANNITPPSPDDQDKADDGVHLNTVNIPKCGRTQFRYDVSSTISREEIFVNVWFDFNRDGDWEDVLKCETEEGEILRVREWAVQDQVIGVTPGMATYSTPLFAAMDPPNKEEPMWMRITLSDSKVPVPAALGRADGRGPVPGYKLGETEDYYLQGDLSQPGEVCGMKWHDENGNGIKDVGEAGLGGWTIEIYGTAGNLIATAVTDANGNYCFTLQPGTYTVGELLQLGWLQTFPTAPGTHTVTLGFGQSIVDVDFGNRKKEQDIRCSENSIDAIDADVKPGCDLGDAPDSTSHFDVDMLTYPTNVIARFPTVYDGPEPRGPRHFNVSDNQRLAWLGRDITCEHDADIGADCDGVNNITPPAPADQDRADDGVRLDTLNIPKCGKTQFRYDVSNTISTELVTNVWFDFNRDGDWEDVLRCETEEGKVLEVPEWAIQNQGIFVPGIIPTFTTPLFAAMDPPSKENPMWMRITLSERNVPLNPDTNLADGRGPVPGYKMGETEDYYLQGNQEPVCVPPPSDMKAWWTLDEAGGMVAHDRAGFPNDGIHMNGPTPSAGKVAGALTFDGVNDHIEVDDHPELNFGESNFTIDAWIRTRDAKGYRPIVDKRSSGAADAPFGYNLFLRDGQLGFNINTESAFGGGSSAGGIASSPNLADGEWHFVAVTVDRGSTTGGKLYVDGAVVHTFDATTLVGDADNGFPLIIASRNRFFGPPVDNFFEGELDEIEIFHRDLTADEILAIYQADRLGKCKEGGEIHGTKWEDLNGNGVQDRGEPGLSGWTIILTNAAGSSYSTTTDADGNYWFMDLPPGKYRVTEIIQNGWKQTFPKGGGHSVKLEDGEVLEGINFGNWPKSDESCHVGWDINVFNTNSNTIEVGMNISNQSGTDADYQLQVVGSPTMIVYGFTATTPFDAGQPLPTPPVFVPGNGNVYVAVFMSPLPTILGPSGQYQVIVTNPDTGHSFGCSAQLWQNDDVGVQPVDNVLIQELEPGQPMEIMFEVQNLGEEEIVPVMRVDQMFGVDGEELAALRVDIPEADRLQAEPLKADGGLMRVPVMVELMEAAPNNAIGDVILFVDVDGDGEPDVASSVIVRMVDEREDAAPIDIQPQALEAEMGDVNCDDKINSVDALLILQYNIGLRGGADSCLRARNGELYSPVCDLNDNEDCDSIDALFVLQCDIGMPNKFCPEGDILSNDGGEVSQSKIEEDVDSMAQEPSVIHLTYPDIVTKSPFIMSVMVDMGTVSLGTASVRLNYDRTQFEVTNCPKNDSGAALRQCNPEHKDDKMVRFNFTVTEGMSGKIELADIGFKHIGETVDMSAFNIDVLTFADIEGEELNFTVGDSVVTEPTVLNTSPPRFEVYLPLVDH